jgi:DNA modification methylase
MQIELQKEFDEKVEKAYSTKIGTMWQGKIESALKNQALISQVGKVDLIFTSPPYPLIKKKEYGNKVGEEYLDWLRSLAPKLTELLSPTGSIVIELGNAWVPGRPEMSTLPVRSLLAFQEAADLHLCQHLIWQNPARLPSPAQWVNIERSRLKDSFTHVWWLGKNERPKADNRRVLVPYGKDMKKLLEKQAYNSGKRPSGHVISSKGFLKNHGGAISSSVLYPEDTDRIPNSLLEYANTNWDNNYSAFCKEHDLPAHPARMPMALAAFMIQFLTEPGDLVLDPFAGSNTTGATAESLDRKWISIEAQAAYVEGSRSRFEGSVIGRPKRDFLQTAIFPN